MKVKKEFMKSEVVRKWIIHAMNNFHEFPTDCPRE